MPSPPAFPAATSFPSASPLSPAAGVLRHRASALRSFAGTIDRLLVTRIDAEELDTPAITDSVQWCMRRHLLDHSLHQLHRASDDLREMAHEMWQRADILERSRHSVMTTEA